MMLHTSPTDGSFYGSRATKRYTSLRVVRRGRPVEYSAASGHDVVVASTQDPRSLTWAEVDPGRWPFDRAEAVSVVRALPAARVYPLRLAEFGVGWVTAGTTWTDAMSGDLAAQYGAWALGWRFARGEGDVGGGPVTVWCCPSHSITTWEATLGRVTGALIEWRGWLEELAGVFAAVLPALEAEQVDTRRLAWQRAVGDLVTLVVERTGAEDAWFGHCAQVLGWALEYAGVPDGEQLACRAIGGRFDSWVDPAPGAVEAVAASLANDVVHDADN